MIVLHASFPIDPEKRDDARQLVDRLVEQSNREEGVIEYRAAIDLRDENTIRFFERYEDEDAVTAHERSDHFGAFAERLPELLDGEPEVKRFEVASATDVEL